MLNIRKKNVVDHFVNNFHYGKSVRSSQKFELYKKVLSEILAYWMCRIRNHHPSCRFCAHSDFE